MKIFKRATRLALALTLLASAFFSSLPASAQQVVTVVEYYSKPLAAYFLTGRASEQATLDGLSGFERTGMTFQAVDASGPVNPPLDRVCRYRIAVTGSTSSSHFYGLTADCDVIASYNLSNFFNEGYDFAVVRPVNGVCSGAYPISIYRSLRTISPVETPNHRYTTSLAAYNSMTARGWSGEGVVFCTNAATAETARPAFASASSIESYCAVPRSGVNPYTMEVYPDRPGTLSDEKAWLRSWSDETYLWYREIPALNADNYGSAVSYFNALKTPAVALSGRAKDGFHFSESSEAADQENAGETFGYGISWSLVRSTPPRNLVVAIVNSGSPADLAGIRRGASIVSIDGVDVAYGSNVAILNDGLYPSVAGTTHVFEVLDQGASAPRTVNLVAQALPIKPVPAAGYINTASGRVGYLALTTFSTYAAEFAVVNAVAGLKASNISDLVVDLRYNGGGFLDISAQLAYMIAGPASTSGKFYEKTKFNDKLPFGIYGSGLDDILTPFHATTLGFSAARGQALPTLNLPRVYVLTSARSCSASESLINGLRGAGVVVHLIGNTTCGKPYGFYATDNCGTTYYSIQFTGVNFRGEGDYIDGFAATCAATDDLTQPLGDPAEKQLSVALAYRATGLCTPASSLIKRAEPDNRSAANAIRENRLLSGGVKRLLPGLPAVQQLPTISPVPVRDLSAY